MSTHVGTCSNVYTVVSYDWSFMHTLRPYRTTRHTCKEMPWLANKLKRLLFILSAHGMMNIAIHYVCVNLPRALTYRNQQ